MVLIPSHLSFTLQWEDCTRDTFLWGYFAGAQAENSDLEEQHFYRWGI